MSIRRCKACRHWDTREPADGWGYCDRAGFYMNNKDPRGRDDPDSLAVANDASDYSACLVTAPNFGCVQWQAKPAEKQ